MCRRRSDSLRTKVALRPCGGYEIELHRKADCRLAVVVVALHLSSAL
jgi:hypothetical protein